jgi:hypothetical protein
MFLPVSRLLRLLAPAFALTLVGCSDGSDGPAQGPAAAPFKEIIDQGVTRYLGLYTPMSSEVNGNTTVHTFGTGDGPLCQDEGPYIMSTRDAGSEDLLIFLQGGGACWSDVCLSNETATPGIPEGGVLNPDLAENPMRDWNVAYFNYCDGGLHASDRDWGPVGGDLDNRKQRGLHNLSAGLDVTAREFPQPRRIVLSGASGGGFGTIFALPLVRTLYPDVPIQVLNDSGVGVGRPGEPEFIELLLTDWNIWDFIPESCGERCYENGHLTNYFDWQIDQDPNMTQAMMSYQEDFVISVTFSRIGGPAFKEALLEEMATLENIQPERVRSFLAAGDSHTFIGGDLNVTAGGTRVTDWLSAMLAGEGWETTIDE